MYFELIGLLIMLKLSVHISKKAKKLTLWVIVLLIAESLVFFAEKCTQSFEHLSLLRPMFTACIYSIYPVILIVIMRLLMPGTLSKGKYLLLLAPEILSIPLYFTSQWSHLVCYYTDDNHYMGGPLSNLPYAVFGLYLVIFLIYNIRFFRGYSYMNRFAYGYIVVAAIVGVLFYTAYESNNDYGELFATSILVYYIFIYIHEAKLDTLTRLLNRQCFYQDTETLKKSITGIVSVDMNYLKYLNDNYGHEAGDKALKTIAEILKSNRLEHGMAYRIGGDAFIILYTNSDEAEMKKAILLMKDALDKTEYSCAFGYAVKMPGDSIDDVLRNADKKMYENKFEMKKEMPEPENG